MTVNDIEVLLIDVTFYFYLQSVQKLANKKITKNEYRQDWLFKGLANIRGTSGVSYVGELTSQPALLFRDINLRNSR